MIKKIVAISTILLLFLSLSGCLGDVQSISVEEKRFVGTWDWSSDTEQNTYTFYQNKSLYSSYIHIVTKETHMGWGTFEVKDEKLYCATTHGHEGQTEAYCYSYSFSQDDTYLTLSAENLPAVTLIKQIDYTEKFIGNWKTDSDSEMIIHPNGECIFHGLDGTWKLEDDLILITTPFTGGENTLGYSYIFSDNFQTVALSGSSEQKIFYYKQS
jgi:hypothetical protein